MIERILETWRSATFDFRTYAYDDDPLQDRFESWVPYYQLKWAIASVIQPTSIIEMGVRYGYSAAAFLDACPTARYLGIDLDIDRDGGVSGALDWARTRLAGFRTEFLRADSQAMDQLPGERWDLAHVDGQRDGDSTFRDLEKALRQADWILLDGYFWNSTNFRAAGEFLLRHHGDIEFVLVIPSYAGELLVRRKEPGDLAAGHSSTCSGSSSSIQNAYTRQYFLEDCGGYDAWAREQGRRLLDHRLQSVAALASVTTPTAVLDLGCGRGELAYHFASRGAEVSAIDYSAPAIELARLTIEGDPAVAGRVDLICGDVGTVAIRSSYDMAVASDIVEHLAQPELERLVERVADALSPDGRFVLHTYPNRWYYEHEYPRRRARAAELGAYLPIEPRTPAEILMHINEQDPEMLEAVLRARFKHVEVWCGSPVAPGAGLDAEMSRDEAETMPDLFAVASHAPIDRSELLSAVSTHPLDPGAADRLTTRVTRAPATVAVGRTFTVAVELDNASPVWLTTSLPHPVRLSSHWRNVDGSWYLFDGLRTEVLPWLAPGASDRYDIKVMAPDHPGRYLLDIVLVQEGVRWLDDPEAPCVSRLEIDVVA
jgi:SAM-dependent methyltransferase